MSQEALIFWCHPCCIVYARGLRDIFIRLLHTGHHTLPTHTHTLGSSMRFLSTELHDAIREAADQVLDKYYWCHFLTVGLLNY